MIRFVSNAEIGSKKWLEPAIVMGRNGLIERLLMNLMEVGGWSMLREEIKMAPDFCFGHTGEGEFSFVSDTLNLRH